MKPPLTVMVLSCAALALFCSGCSSVQDGANSTAQSVGRIFSGKTEEATVTSINRSGKEIQFKVRSSKNKQCVEGVKALQRQDWPAAQRAFESAIQKKATDHRAMFGLGVALEKQGNRADALKNYQAALVSAPQDEHLVIQSAIRRVE